MGKVHVSPYIVLAQQTLFDPSRAPEGRHTAWAYCHVPHGYREDVTDLIEDQIERYAPGFREIILAKNCMTAVDMERHNPNYVGGDINGGLQDLCQLYTRPIAISFPVPDIGKKYLYLLFLYPPRWGRSWSLRLLCGTSRQ